MKISQQSLPTSMNLRTFAGKLSKRGRRSRRVESRHTVVAGLAIRPPAQSEWELVRPGVVSATIAHPALFLPQPDRPALDPQAGFTRFAMRFPALAR